MSLRMVVPATLADAAECVGTVQAFAWACIRLQLARGPSMALRDEQDRTLMLAGIFPCDDGTREAWFIVGPLAAARLPTVLRRVRLTLRGAEYRGIKAMIATREGRRIARAAGFEPAGAIDGIEVWELRHERTIRRRRLEGSGGGGEGAGSGGAADPAGAAFDGSGAGGPGEELELADEGPAPPDLHRRL